MFARQNVDAGSAARTAITLTTTEYTATNNASYVSARSTAVVRGSSVAWIAALCAIAVAVIVVVIIVVVVVCRHKRYSSLRLAVSAVEWDLGPFFVNANNNVNVIFTLHGNVVGTSHVQRTWTFDRLTISPQY